MTPILTSPRVVILHSDRFLGELLRHCITAWGDARVEVFEENSAAWKAIEASKPDALITDLPVEDATHAEHIRECSDRGVPILILTTCREESLIGLLRQVRFDGIFDAGSESLESFRLALGETMNRQPYVSASLVPLVARCSA